MPMSCINFDKSPFWLEEGWLAEPVIFSIGHYIPYKTILLCIFLIIFIWSRKKKGNRCYLKKINYNEVNSNFFLSVSKVCASLVCSGGICPGGICPREYIYVLGGKCPGGICPRG